ncbi:MAG: hypothetical protein U1E15_00260 [Hyphomicrobiales bacterium]
MAGPAALSGNWAGFISYDFGRARSQARIPASTAPIAPDMEFHRFDTVIAVDHPQERAWIIAAHGAEDRYAGRAWQSQQALGRRMMLRASLQPAARPLRDGHRSHGGRHSGQ